jgi:heme-NO-binding protein|tara:strand:- start:150 stop:689 length:540 start_codon:yes stop_codon:yes gene_type:complete
MKGIIFTEFLEMVEEKFDYQMVDSIITDAQDPLDGAYTSVNTYDHAQLVNLVIALHKRSGIPLPDLLRTYGEYLFGGLAKNYPNLLKDIKDPFDMLLNIEILIHTEVRKLYPEANPPKFTGTRIDDKTIELVYNSHRSMGDVAEGLIIGCGKHFGVNYKVEQTASDNNGQTVNFRIERV